MDAILQRLSKLSDAELRVELKSAGLTCGGIAKSTRKFFEKRLAKHILATTGSGQEQDTPDGGVKSDGTEKATDGSDGQKSDATIGNVEPKTNDVNEAEKKGSEVKVKTPSDGLFYVVQLPTDDMDIPDAPTFKVPLCSARVYENRKEAFDMMKRNKGARFKVFKSQREADTFVNSHQDLSTPKRVESVSRTGAASNMSGVSESANCYHSPKNQQLVGLRKAIEANDHQQYKDIIWDNPRYLISSGDTPTIMKEGPRYNAIHVTALGNLASMCRLIIETLEDPQFFSLMYPDDSAETRQKRQQVLLDLYLNMPDKGNCETPLHFASKFGNADVVEVLVDNIVCDKTAKNKYGQTAKQIACSRAGDDRTKKRIIHLLEDSYYIPLLRSDDNSTQPVIGEPWSPDQAGMRQMNAGIRIREESPVDVNICTKAYAGPMSPSEAETFHKHLRTPPSAESKRAAAIRRADSEKGLERVARELARSMHVPWAEYWEFLDACVDLSSSEGLSQLEEYLQGRQPAQSQGISKAGDGQTNHQPDAEQLSTSSDELVTNLMASFENLTITPSNETSPHVKPNRTSTSDALDKEQTTESASSVPMATDISNLTDRTKTLPLCVVGANETNLEASISSTEIETNLQEQSVVNVDNKTSSEPSGTVATSVNLDNVNNQTEQVSSKSEDENMDVSDKHQEQLLWEKYGNGDDGRGLMETPKSNMRTYPSCSGCNDSMPVYLVGTEPTKLDLDVLRAVSYADNINTYPCIQKWKQQVQIVPEDVRKRWPTPAKYRAQSPSPSVAPNTSPRNISSTQRLYNSPIHASSPARILLGSPHLLRRSRHLSDPGLARQQRRVYTTSPAGHQQEIPRLRLFP